MKKTLYGIISFSLILLIFSQTQAQNQVFDSLANEIDRIAYQKTKSFEMLEKLYQIAYNDPDSTLLIAYCLYEESLLNFRQRIVDTLLFNKIKERDNRKNILPFEQALLQCGTGINLMTNGEYADAFPVLLQVLKVFKEHNHDILTVRTLNLLSNICFAINLFILAEHYHSEAMQYVTPDFYGYYFMKINAFIMLSYQNREAAIDSLQCLIEFAEKEHIEEILPILYLNIGSFFLATQPEKALTFFTKMQKIDFQNPAMTATLYANMGSYYSGKKEFLKALKYFKDAQKIMEKNNDFFNLSPLYNDISLIFEELNQYDSALYYSKKNQELTLRLRSNLVAIETYQKYVTTFLEASKNELIIAEQTIKLKNIQFIIISIISAFAVIVILLFLLYTHQQKLRKASENRELASKLEHEKRVKQYEKRQRRLEKEKQEAVIDAKTREITSYSMLVSNKNKMLKQIQELTSQIYDSKETAFKTAQKIDKIVQSNLNIDEEWENFKMHFDKVHPHFFEKLKQHCSDLTEENLRMCAYIKMRMTTKQIAQLLQVIPNSIITNRYRLKKKLQLADEEDLDEFIGEL